MWPFSRNPKLPKEVWKLSEEERQELIEQLNWLADKCYEEILSRAEKLCRKGRFGESYKFAAAAAPHLRGTVAKAVEELIFEPALRGRKSADKKLEKMLKQYYELVYDKLRLIHERCSPSAYTLAPPEPRQPRQPRLPDSEEWWELKSTASLLLPHTLRIEWLPFHLAKDFKALGTAGYFILIGQKAINQANYAISACGKRVLEKLQRCAIEHYLLCLPETVVFGSEMHEWPLWPFVDDWADEVAYRHLALHRKMMEIVKRGAELEFISSLGKLKKEAKEIEKAVREFEASHRLELFRRDRYCEALTVPGVLLHTEGIRWLESAELFALWAHYKTIYRNNKGEIKRFNKVEAEAVRYTLAYIEKALDELDELREAARARALSPVLKHELRLIVKEGFEAAERLLLEWRTALKEMLAQINTNEHDYRTPVYVFALLRSLSYLQDADIYIYPIERRLALFDPVLGERFGIEPFSETAFLHSAFEEHGVMSVVEAMRKDVMETEASYTKIPTQLLYSCAVKALELRQSIVEELGSDIEAVLRFGSSEDPSLAARAYRLFGANMGALVDEVPRHPFFASYAEQCNAAEAFLAASRELCAPCARLKALFGTAPTNTFELNQRAPLTRIALPWLLFEFQKQKLWKRERLLPHGAAGILAYYLVEGILSTGLFNNVIANTWKNTCMFVPNLKTGEFKMEWVSRKSLDHLMQESIRQAMADDPEIQKGVRNTVLDSEPLTTRAACFYGFMYASATCTRRPTVPLPEPRLLITPDTDIEQLARTTLDKLFAPRP
ncbi:MAG: hypothetical protein QXI60_05840 [Thermofilaceae archaeon]